MASEQSSTPNDYYTSLLERVDGAISSPTPGPEPSVTRGGSGSFLDQAQTFLFLIAAQLGLFLAWLYARALEAYHLARRKYYQHNRRTGSGNNSTPFSSLTAERRDSIEL